MTERKTPRRPLGATGMKPPVELAQGAEQVAEIALALTKAQQRALLCCTVVGTCSYSMGVALNTLAALHSRKLVMRHARVGSVWSPHTNMEWPLTPLGLAVRAELERLAS